MANRAYLLAVDDKAITWSKDPSTEIVAEGINEIPVLWASLFVQEDRVLDGYGENGEVKVANWCVKTVVAKERIARLEKPIENLLDPKSKGTWAKWVKHITGLRSTYLKTNAVEVWELDSDEYEKSWNKLLRFFAQPSVERLGEAVQVNDLTFKNGAIHWSEPEKTACKLAGAEHIAEVPWMSDLPEADPPTAEEIEQKRQYAEIMRQAEQQLADARRVQRLVRIGVILAIVVGLALAGWLFFKK